MAAPTPMCDQQCLEWIRLGLTVAIPALSGFIGVVVGAWLGAWLTSRRERGQRRLAFIEKQLKEFYSPMLGLRTDIRMRSELRVKIQDAANSAWRELCEAARGAGVDALRDISASRGPEFKRVIDYDNEQLQNELLPNYRQMAKLFRDNYWLADLETRRHYSELVEFVELWDRWLAKAIPPEVIEKLGHSEDRLNAFYDQLATTHDALRNFMERGEV